MTQKQLPARLDRVKVYNLNEKGTWDDKGIGSVRIEESLGLVGQQQRTPATGAPGRSIVVLGEVSGRPIMVAHINSTNNYQRQGDGTIITWNDPDFRTDVALSFQHGEGCEQIWKQIESLKSSGALHGQGQREGNIVQGVMIDELASTQNQQSPQAAAMGGAGVSVAGQAAGPYAQNAVDIPPLEIPNLASISQILGDVHPCDRDGIAAQLRGTDFCKKLSEAFHMLEDVEDIENLHHVNEIMKFLIMLNDPPILDQVFSDAMIMDTIGMLEYNPSFPERPNHRATLMNQVTFKEVVPIKRPEVLSKIHQTFRISFIRDTILPIVLDDATFGSLSSIILFNNVEILRALHQDPEYLKSLFSKFQNVPSGSKDWDDLIAFLQETCDLAKHLQAQQRHQLLTTLIKLGLFKITDTALNEGLGGAKIKGMDILVSVLSYDPASLRNYIRSQEDHSFLLTLVRMLVTENEHGLQEQTCDILRMLLDPESMTQTQADKNEFLELFYQKCFPNISGMIVLETNSNTLVLISDLLCFCIHVHSIWIKYSIMRSKLLSKVCALLYHKQKVVVLAALRILRICIGLRDGFYITQIVEGDLLGPVVDIFIRNGDQYNMLNSAIIELFEFVKRENVKPLVKYYVERFGDNTKLSGVDYVQCFKQLKTRHEQNVKAEEVKGAQSAMAQQLKRMRKRRDGSMDKEEEDYFMEKDQDGGAAAGASMGAAVGGMGGGVGGGMGGGIGVGVGPTTHGHASPGLLGSGHLERPVILQSPFSLSPLVDFDLKDSGSSDLQVLPGNEGLLGTSLLVSNAMRDHVAVSAGSIPMAAMIDVGGPPMPAHASPAVGAETLGGPAPGPMAGNAEYAPTHAHAHVQQRPTGVPFEPMVGHETAAAAGPP